jgi:hypothetical protein
MKEDPLRMIVTAVLIAFFVVVISSMLHESIPALGATATSEICYLG